MTSSRNHPSTCLAAALLAAWGGVAHAQLRSFGEAEGFGAEATGSRAAPVVYHVTNLNDSGAGSFRDAVSASNRFVVFDVGGVINLSSAISGQGNITIAGQTAPGEGISLNGYELSFAGRSNVICRYLRLRPGDASPSTDDCLSTYNATNIIVDHVSMEFAKWNNIGAVTDNGGSPQTTFQNCLIADPIGQQFGAHMESIYGNFTFTKNLFANSHNRNPLAKINEQFINNIDYNNEASYTTHTSTPFDHDLVNNAFIWGPAQNGNTFYQLSSGDTFYAAGNVQDTNKDGVLDLNAVAPTTGTIVTTPNIPGTLDLPILPVPDAYAYVVAHAGCSLDRDELDNLVISQVQTLGSGTPGKGVGTSGPTGGLYGSASSTGLTNGGLGSTVGGTRPAGFDTDNDGIPDTWEAAHGLNPNVADALLFNPLGYRMIEQYVNELGDQNVIRTYTGTSGSFTTSAAWAGGTVAGPLDKAVIAGTGTANGAATVASGTTAVMALALGGNGPAPGERLVVSGGKLDVYDTLTVAAANNATVSITGGTLEAYNVVLGATLYPSGAMTSGTVTLAGGTLGLSSLVKGAGGPSAWTGGGQLVFTGGAIRAIGDLAINAPMVVTGTGGVIDTNGFDGTISGLVSGSGGLTKKGAGTLAITGSNTMMGGVKISSGTVAVNHVAAIGSGSITLAGGNVVFGSVSGIAAPVFLQSSGTLSAGGITLNGPITGGSGVKLAIATSSGGSSNLTLAGGFTGFAGTVDLNATTGNVRLNATGTQGSGTAKFDLGTSTATLRTAFTATVALGSLAGGTGTRLQGSTNDSGLVTYVIGGNGSNTTFSGTITDGVSVTPGVTGITKTGAGTLVLAGTASTYTGATRISGGTLSVGTLANGGTASGLGQASADPANLVLDGGTLQYTGPAVTIDRGFTVTANGGTIERHGSGNLVLGGTADIVMAGTGDRTLTLSGSATSFNNLSAGIPDPASGRTTLVKAGPGTWRLVGSGRTYSGDTMVNGGSLFLVSAGALPTGAGKGDVTVAAGATLDLYGNSHTINGLDGAGTVTTTINSGRTLTVGNGDAGGDFAGLLTQGTAQSLALAKVGSGTQRLGAASNYAGGTSLRGGTLVAAASNALGMGAVSVTGSARQLLITGSASLGNAIVVNAPTGTADGGVIHYDGPGRGILAGGTITIFSAPGNGGLFGSSGGGDLRVDGPVVVQGTARVSVRTGTVTFGGGGSYGGLDVMQGTVRLGRANGLATSASVTLGTSGSATLDLAGYDQSLAGIAQAAGAAVIGNASTTQDARLTITGSATYAGTIRDAVGGGSRRVSLAVNGGNLRLIAANSFTGTTSVAAGSLHIGHAAAVASSPLALLSGGTVAVDAGLAVQVPAVTIATDALVRLSPSVTTTLATSLLVVDGRFELGAGRVEIAAGGISQDSLIAALLAGRGDGSWTGSSGITSAAAAADLGSGIIRAVGWTRGDDGSFATAFTAPGDTNVDGQVDILDAANFVAGGLFDSWQPAVWTQGDFNYDAVVDILDAADLLGTGLFDQGPFVPSASSAAGAIAAVPEPAGLPWLAVVMACIGFTARRRWPRGCAGIGASCLLGAAASAATIHVAPHGDDAAAGTAGAPLASVQRAVERARPGDVIRLADGRFACAGTLLLDGTGTAEMPYRIEAAPGARPVLDFAGTAPADEKQRSAARGAFLTGDHWVLSGLEICHAPDNGLKIEGCHNRIERCVFHHNGDSGLQIGLAKKSRNDGSLAAHNTVVNCDSFRNFDLRTKGENADGFACKLFPGPGNSFIGCRAWENADDGWDLFMTTFPVTLDCCWAWHNGDPKAFPSVSGNFAGDGNGFKLGGQDRPAGHVVRRCIAFDHPFGSGNGFEDNNNTAAITLQHCTAWGNRTNFQFKKAAHVVENSASFAPTRSKSGVEFDADVVCRGNSWQPDPNPKKKGKYISSLAADAFTGLDAALAAADRAPEGGLPANGLARPAAGSGMIDAGVDLGLPFSGTAPDIGAIEVEPGADLQKTAPRDPAR
mgnify:CR=1 FL=1